MAKVQIKTGATELQSNKSIFKQVHSAMVGHYQESTTIQKQAGLNTLQNWGTASASQKADALYMAVTLLYLAVFYLIVDRLRDE